MDDPVTVLAVDDQSVNLRLLDAVLTPRGHRVITASSGAEALSLLETEDVDLVLSDVVMPEMDGYEVCRRIRSNPSTEFLPVVMITASGSEQRLNALMAGADDFITKPFDQSELLARVASLARIKRYHDTIRRQADELAAWNTELESRVADAGRRTGAGKPVTPFPVTAIGRSGHQRRAPPREPSPRNRRGLRRYAELHPVRRDQRARGGDGGARGVPPGDGGVGARIPGHAGAIHRRRDHGVLQRSDPARRRRRARRPHGVGDPRCGERAGRSVASQRLRPRSRAGDRPGLRDSRPDRLRRALRLRRDRQRHESRRAAVLGRRSLAGAGHRPHPRRHRAHGRRRRGRRRAAQGIQPDGTRPQHFAQ